MINPRPISIGIDGNEANTIQRVGSNIYAHQILHGLHSLDKTTTYLVYLKAFPTPDLPSVRDNWSYRILPPGQFWTQWRLPLDLYLHQPRPNLFFTPGHYAPRFSPAPSVISIMDLAFLHFPQTFKPLVLLQLKNWTAHSIKHAVHILTISNNTKQDIINHYHIDPAKITVIYPGPNLKFPPQWDHSIRSQIVKQYSLPNKYFIFIGTRQPRKNLNRLLQALNRLNQNRQNPISLVVVGKTWHQFSLETQEESPHVIYTGYVPDNDLVKLLLASQALIFPSLYEGFGLPVLEAMQLGVPVIASRSSSIPEITGQSPFLFDPTDIGSIDSSMNRFLNTKQTIKKKIVQQGKIRASRFTWEKCVKQTMEVLHELAV